ncbi:hypothetical protein [Amycolatopsis pretoriensis]|uniref:hypothetical protein n=1 Tax=Amycolatopsis pretoriensis TaxID=218821 RepID=UPI000A3A31C5|nr:hypothetical protein [Amycolatopsis pretoriensis]
MAQPHTDVDPWLAGVDVQVQDNTGATASGAGFSLSPGEAKTILAQALNALDQLQQLQRQTEILKQVSPAAHDPASIAYNARLVSGHGVFDAAGDHVNAEAKYLHELIAKIQVALRQIGDRDGEAARELGSPNGGVAG